MRKLLDAIWEPFDEKDPTEWLLLCVGMFAVVVISIIQVLEWIGQ